MAYQVQPSHLSMLDNNGDPLAASVQAYITGTVTPRDMFPTAADAEASTNAVANPFTLSATGKGQLWLKTDDDINYTIEVSHATITTITTDDYIPIGAFENTSAPAFPQGHIDGLITSNSGVDSAHDIVIATGECRDSTDANNINLTSSIIKRIDADFVEGTNNGGFPSALTLTSETKYHVFILLKDDGTVDAGFDTSLTATNLLTDATNYLKFRRIGFVQTNDSTNIEQFVQDGDDFIWVTPIQDLSTNVLTTSELQLELSVPIDVRVKAVFSVKGTHHSNVPYVYIRPLESTDSAPDGTEAPLATTSMVGPDSQGPMVMLTNTSGKIGFRSSESNTTMRVLTTGWQDNRGKQ